MRKYNGKIVFTEILKHHDGKEFIKVLQSIINDAQKKKLYVEIKYSTEISNIGVVYTALIIGRIDKNHIMGKFK